MNRVFHAVMTAGNPRTLNTSSSRPLSTSIFKIVAIFFGCARANFEVIAEQVVYSASLINVSAIDSNCRQDSNFEIDIIVSILGPRYGRSATLQRSMFGISNIFEHMPLVHVKNSYNVLPVSTTIRQIGFESPPRFGSLRPPTPPPTTTTTTTKTASSTTPPPPPPLTAASTPTTPTTITTTTPPPPPPPTTTTTNTTTTTITITEHDGMESFFPQDKQAWRTWLESNHEVKDSIWLIVHKKTSVTPNISWGEAVDEALCFGWIDSVKKAIDGEKYKQFFSKRRPKSTWSRINKEKVARFIAQGLMSEAGLQSIDIAKQNGSWTILDQVESLELPDDLKKAFQKRKGSREYYESLTKSGQKRLLSWVVLAKRKETRQTRIREIAENAIHKRMPKQLQ